MSGWAPTSSAPHDSVERVAQGDLACRPSRRPSRAGVNGHRAAAGAGRRTRITIAPKVFVGGKEEDADAVTHEMIDPGHNAAP